MVLTPVLMWASFIILPYPVVNVLSTGSVTLNGPGAVAVDSQGNVYIADTGDNQVVELTAAGTSSIVSIPGLGSANSVAVDGSGNLYVADATNSRVVELSGGVVSVVPTASLLTRPSGLAFDAGGDLYIADATHNYIVEVPAGGGTAATLTITGLGATPLNQPYGLAVDISGNLYIADSANNRIVEVTLPAAFVGAGAALPIAGESLNTPLGVAVDGFGNVYIADENNSRVVTVSGGNGAVLGAPLFGAYASPVPLTLSNPAGVAVTAFGAIYIANTGGNQIVEVMPSATGFGHLPVGAGSGTTLTLPFLVGFSTIGGVQAYTEGAPLSDFTVVSGSGTTCVAGFSGDDGDVACAVQVTFLPTGAGLRRGAVVIYNNATPPAPIITVPVYGTGDAPLATLSPGTASVISTGGVATLEPFQITEDGAGNLYVADYEGNNVLKVPPGGGSATVVSLAGLAMPTNEIAGVALDGAGDLFICDHFGDRIIEIPAGGTAVPLTINGLSPGLSIPTGLAVDAANNLYISDYGHGRVVKVTPSGAGSAVATPGFTPAADSVLGVAVDAAGTVYMPDSLANRIIKVTANGAASLVVPEGITPPLSSPLGVAVDGFGNLYIADIGNARIVEVTTAGVASIVPTPGLTGPVTLGTYYALAADSFGNLLIPDFGYNRLVDVNLSAAALAFPNTDVGSVSSMQTATVTNIGDLPLVFSANPPYTANFSENTGDTNLCLLGTSVGGGEHCDVSVGFTPQSTGSLSASITVTNNNLNGTNATENVAVSGTGVITPTAVALEASLNPAFAGQSVTLTATVSPAPIGSSLGTVNFYSNAALLGSGNLNSSGIATFSTAALAVGSDSLTAVYSGNAGFVGSTSSALTETINALTTTTTALTATPNPAAVGQSVTLTATVTPPPTEPEVRSSLVPGAPSLGTVSFYYGETLLGSGNVSSLGVATATTTSLPVGADGLTAAYSGASGFTASTSSVFTETILTTTTTTLTAAPNPAVTGQSVTLTATVSPAPTGSSLGTVSFYNGVTLLGSGNVNSSGVATFSIASLPAGADSLTAAYSGNATSATSTSSALTETVSALAGTTTTLAASPNPAVVGGTVTLTATISPAPTGTTAGTVSFYSGSTLLGTETVNSSGVATFTASTLPTGALSLTAVYSGNAAFAGSSSSALTETVNTTYTVTAPPAPITAAEGGSIVINVTVPPVGGAFDSVVTMSASGLPPGATATFDPPTVTPGITGAPTVLTIQLAPAAAGMFDPHRDFPYRNLPVVPLAATMGLFAAGFSRKRHPRMLKRAAAFAVLACFAATLIGCGGGFAGPPSTQPGSYVVTITGTSGSTQASTTVTVVVQ
jgi:sugar lactone lactonase YvrE